MKMPVLYIQNKSTLITDANVALMVKACQKQLSQHVAPLLGRRTWRLKTLSGSEVVPEGEMQIIVMDDADQAGALGYHTQDPQGNPWGRVFVNPVTKSGGTWFSGALSVSVVLSHEVIETFMDSSVNLWADMTDGEHEVAYEFCDPVEADAYEIDVTSKDGVVHHISVSNFVTEHWFDAYATNEKLDYMDRTPGPLKMSKGGYMVVYEYSSNKVTNVFGSSEAEAHHNKIKPAHSASRAAKRLNT